MNKYPRELHLYWTAPQDSSLVPYSVPVQEGVVSLAPVIDLFLTVIWADIEGSEKKLKTVPWMYY